MRLISVLQDGPLTAWLHPKMWGGAWDPRTSWDPWDWGEVDPSSLQSWAQLSEGEMWLCHCAQGSRTGHPWGCHWPLTCTMGPGTSPWLMDTHEPPGDKVLRVKQCWIHSNSY